ncbi:MAG: GntR family transcriptional regulator [Oscillospiraceae bacterium]
MYKYNEVMEQILNDLTALAPHERVASRKALCMKYDVTRTTVDRAISELIDKKYLYAKVGSGTFVADQTQYDTKISCWGVILPNVANQVYPDMLEGISNFAAKHNINVIICNSDNNNDKELAHISRLMQSKVEGYIIAPCISTETDYRVYRQLQQNKIPFVFCNRYVDGVKAPYISSNSFFGGYLATEHLIKRGYTHIAFVAKDRYKSSIERFSGYCAALHRYNLELDHNLIITDYENEADIKDMLQRYKPDAIFAFNDTIASAIYSILDQLGLRAGRDISLIGYDNSRICNMLPVKLTSVSYMAYEIGYKAASVLYDMQVNKLYPRPDIILFEPKIIERKSCVSDSKRI